MQEEKKQEHEGGGANEESRSGSRQDDATSSETLSDIEEKEKVSDKGSTETSEGTRSDAPSPDGAFDDKRGGDPAGPM